MSGPSLTPDEPLPWQPHGGVTVEWHWDEEEPERVRAAGEDVELTEPGMTYADIVKSLGYLGGTEAAIRADERGKVLAEIKAGVKGWAHMHCDDVMPSPSGSREQAESCRERHAREGCRECARQPVVALVPADLLGGA